MLLGKLSRSAILHKLLMPFAFTVYSALDEPILDDSTTAVIPFIISIPRLQPIFIETGFGDLHR